MASIALLEPYQHGGATSADSGYGTDVIRALILSAQRKIEQARLALEAERPVEAGFYIGRTTSIVDALRDALDIESGGQMARDFDCIYEHIDACLQVAVCDVAPQALRQAREAVSQLSVLWQAGQCTEALGAGTG